MKLLHASTLRLSLAAAFVLAFWSVLFYYAIIAEVNDETDDTLENFAETIMIRALSGEELPTNSGGSNNQFFMYPVSAEYAQSHMKVYYEDRDVYIQEKKEYEPARVLMHIFQMDNGEWMHLEVSTPTIEKKDLIEAIFFWMVVLYSVLFICIVLTNYWGMRRNMRPLYNLLSWVNRYIPGKKNVSLDNATQIEEFQQLNDVISSALKRSEALHEQQKQFIGNASHEMQTPLAICIGRLEMLMEDETLGEEQLMEVIKTHRTLKNLSKMNRSLLLLCKIEGGQFDKKTEVDFNLLLNTILPDFKMVFAHKEVQAELHCEHPFKHLMEESLATTLVSNLLKNAFAHNVKGGSVRVSITQHCMRFENTGVAEALQEDAIFTRFYHTPGKAASTGLGLPIVQAICQLYELGIRYTFEDGKHVFTITKN